MEFDTEFGTFPESDGEGAVKNLPSYSDSTKETPNASLSPARTETEKKQDNSNSNKLFFKRG